MKPLKIIFNKFAYLFLAFNLCGISVYAQDEEDVVIRSQQVSEGIYMLSGKGGNLGLSIGKDGTFLIDDQYAPLTEKIMAKIRSLGGDTPRFLVSTHFHGDHTGGNENFGNAGATLVAHDNVRKRLMIEQTISAFGFTMAPQPEAGLPVVTYAENMHFHLNGQTISVQHYPNSHTDGDSVLYFKQANVIHTGDIYFNGFFPFIDIEHGGSLRGLIRTAKAILEKADDNTKIIPGHGPLSNKAELTNYVEMLKKAYLKLSKLKREGKTVKQAIAAKPLKRFDEQWGQAMFTADRWIEIVYDGLK